MFIRHRHLLQSTSPMCSWIIGKQVLIFETSMQSSLNKNHPLEIPTKTSLLTTIRFFLKKKETHCRQLKTIITLYARTYLSFNLKKKSSIIACFHSKYFWMNYYHYALCKTSIIVALKWFFGTDIDSLGKHVFHYCVCCKWYISRNVIYK